MPLTLLDTRPNAAEAARCTVLFVDLRGYTRVAERLPATQVMELLGEFVALVAEAITRHGGEIFHIAGDGMMAGFGLGDPAAAGAPQALAAGRTMLARFAPVARRWQRELAVETGIGVGLHRGEVAFGHLLPGVTHGPTLVGDTVNVAARLCSRARAGEVLFSAAVAAELAAASSEPAGDGIPFLQLPQFAVRGRIEPLDVWCVPALERVAV